MKRTIGLLSFAIIAFLGQSCVNGPGAISDNSRVVNVSDGYGSSNQKNYTGSATVIEDLDQAIPLDTYLRNVPGVMVLGNGGSAKVRIRGLENSFTGNSDPLFVINGQVIEGGYGAVVNTIPVGTIKSVSVLKDAASTGIYGSRGANGVIVVTLRKATDDQNTKQR